MPAQGRCSEGSVIGATCAPVVVGALRGARPSLCQQRLRRPGDGSRGCLSFGVSKCVTAIISVFKVFIRLGDHKAAAGNAMRAPNEGCDRHCLSGSITCTCSRYARCPPFRSVTEIPIEKCRRHCLHGFPTHPCSTRFTSMTRFATKTPLP